VFPVRYELHFCTTLCGILSDSNKILARGSMGATVGHNVTIRNPDYLSLIQN
jgi:hypothetical protein